MKVFRQSGPSEEGVKVMCSIWALEPEGRVSVEKWEDLEEDLQRAGRSDLASTGSDAYGRDSVTRLGKGWRRLGRRRQGERGRYMRTGLLPG